MLKAKPLAIDTFRENVVVLSRESLELRPERLTGSRKVEVRAAGRQLFATLMIADRDDVVAPDEAGLTEPIFRRLGVRAGDPVAIQPARPPQSLGAIRRKIVGETLRPEDFAAIIRDLVGHAYSDMEVAAFLVACASFMTPDETLDLTRAMIGAGRALKWKNPLVVDKHCIGGVPGNRTSLIVAPIVAAHGLTIPKTSSRAITSPAGTADTMEVFAKVDLDEDAMRAVVDRCGGCIAWGGRVDLSPADDVLISVERPLGVDMPEQMVASILSKKAAAGSTHLVLDIPYGPGAKVATVQAAQSLRKLFAYVAMRLGLTLEVVISDGSRPIGRGIGPVLEARDVRAVLEGRAEAPLDLREKSIMLAGRIIDFDPDAKGSGEARARDLLASGAAARKMDAIIEAQGPSPIRAKLGALACEVTAQRDGVVTATRPDRIAEIARLAGAPTDPGAGVDMLKSRGETVRKGEPLYRIHGDDETDFSFACERAHEDSGVKVEG